jgi:hypothetical protein
LGGALRCLACSESLTREYTDKSLEWALLSWPDRPTGVRRAGESQSAKKKAKYGAELGVVQWRYRARN